MLEDVLAIPDQIRDALWRIDSAQPSPHPARGLVVAGMGGSAIGGDLARDILGPRLTGQFTVWRQYGLPPWIDSDWALLASSYSGNTEETLSAFLAAGKAGVHRWAAGTGGKLAEEARRAAVEVIGLPGLFQPRAAVAYMVAVALHAAHLAGVAPDLRPELESAASFLDDRREQLVAMAGRVATGIGDLPTVVHGSELTVALSRRWATQLNENAKQFAFAASIPEANHNLIEAESNGSGELASVFLLDRDQDHRNRARIGISADLVGETGAPVLSVECEGETRSERLFWGVMLGDLVSLEVARLRGVDPVPVDRIEDLKRRLENTS